MIALVLALCALGACSSDGETHSCADFNEEYQEFGNPVVTEMATDAYFAEHGDQETISGEQVSDLLANVREGCQADPASDVNDHV